MDTPTRAEIVEDQSVSLKLEFISKTLVSCTELHDYKADC